MLSQAFIQKMDFVKPEIMNLLDIKSGRTSGYMEKIREESIEN
jgi:hypothetical protein